MSLNIVLIEPEIPNNTGNIGRLCLASGCTLHLVKPFGFDINDSRLKRAGLDYWQHLDVVYYENVQAFFAKRQGDSFAFLTKNGKQEYTQIPFKNDLYLVFGKESVGLSPELLQDHSENTYSIPIISDHVRSLNLANAVAIVAYEGVKQMQ